MLGDSVDSLLLASKISVGIGDKLNMKKVSP